MEVALDDPDASESLRQPGTNLLALNQCHGCLIHGLLTLASSEERLTTHERVDVAYPAGRSPSTSATDIQDAGVEIRAALASAIVRGYPVLLERLTYNLIDSASPYPGLRVFS